MIRRLVYGSMTELTSIIDVMSYVLRMQGRDRVSKRESQSSTYGMLLLLAAQMALVLYCDWHVVQGTTRVIDIVWCWSWRLRTRAYAMNTRVYASVIFSYSHNWHVCREKLAPRCVRLRDSCYVVDCNAVLKILP